MTSPEQWTWFLTAPGVACTSGDNDGTIPHSRRQADREPWDAGSGYQLGQASQPGGASGMIASGTKYSEWCEERQGVRWLDSEMPCRESGVFGPTPSNHARHAKVARVGGPPHEKLSMKKRRKPPSGDRGHGQFQDLRHLPPSSQEPRRTRTPWGVSFGSMEAIQYYRFFASGRFARVSPSIHSHLKGAIV